MPFTHKSMSYVRKSVLETILRNKYRSKEINQTQKIKKGRRLMKRSTIMQPTKPLTEISTEQFQEFIQVLPKTRYERGGTYKWQLQGSP